MSTNPVNRGYFGIGVEGISKPMNLGAVLRTAHAFHASFCFTIGACFNVRDVLASDTSVAFDSMPVQSLCRRRQLSTPRSAAVWSASRSRMMRSICPASPIRRPAPMCWGPRRIRSRRRMQERCDFIIKIPTRFCVNLSVAGAIVMYDRMISLGRFAERPVRVGGPTAGLAAHKRGQPVWKQKQLKKQNNSA
jgi:hypothetical protein